MDRIMFRGIMPALITPVNEDGTILVANQESGDVRLLRRTEAGLETIGEPLSIPGAVSVFPIAD